MNRRAMVDLGVSPVSQTRSPALSQREFVCSLVAAFMAIVACGGVTAAEKSFDVVAFGAKPDGKTMCTEAIQKATVLILVANAMGFAMADDVKKESEQHFTISPIGWVRKTDATTTIVLDKKYESGLLGLDGFSHVYVFWWFDRNDTADKRKTLQVHPRGDKRNPLTGVFATRSPRRPNLIALSLCKIVSVKDNVVQVEKIDAFADTAVVDLKPYLSGYDTTDDAHAPSWATKKND